MSVIAYLHPAYTQRGGAQYLSLAEARELQRRGHSLRVVTFGLDRELWDGELDGLDVRLLRRHHWRDPLHGLGRSGRIAARGARAARVLDGVDVAVATNYPCNAMLGAHGSGARAVWRCNEPPRRIHRSLSNPRLTARARSVAGEPVELVIRHWRTALADEGSRKRLSQAEFDRRATARLDLVLAISEFARDLARAVYRPAADAVAYPIVEFPARAPAARGADPDAPRVLVNSRLEPHKNIDTLLRAFARVLQRRPRAALEVVGEGVARGELERLAAELLPPGSYRFHGFLARAELDLVAARCDLFALLPIDEPFGLVFPEAAARGLLLLGPDHGGPLEILDGGRLGRCVDPFDPDAAAEALLELAGLPRTERERLRAAADRACRDRFGPSTAGRTLERALLA